MRWIYKTIHFEMKKEGLLGVTFIDETEIEQELNEYGRSGWELISLLEVKDGLIGVLKQPLDEPSVYDEDSSFDQRVTFKLPEEIFETYAVDDADDSFIDESDEQNTLAVPNDTKSEQPVKAERKVGEIRIE